MQKTTLMYCRLLEQNIGNGYLLRVDGKPHCTAWWDAARDSDMVGYAELICIHSLKIKGEKVVELFRIFFTTPLDVVKF